MKFENTVSFAQQMDFNDELGHFREEFIIPVVDGRQHIYFLGNSLGLQPKSTARAIDEILQQWASYGVEGFFMGEKPWLQYHDLLTGPLSVIVGAKPQEISVMNQLTVNLHLMMVSFYRPVGNKRKILCEAKAFPSDQYMFETHVKHYGLNPEEVIIEIAPRPGEHTIRTEDIISAIEANKDELALVFWGGLNYYTGQVFDMRAIAVAAKKAGIYIGFDLAHAAGNMLILPAGAIINTLIQGLAPSEEFLYMNVIIRMLLFPVLPGGGATIRQPVLKWRRDSNLSKARKAGN
jgi:kynureninase